MSGSAASGLTAIAAMIGSTLCYLLGDTAVKLAAEAVPVPQIIVMRGALTALLVTLAAAAAGVLRYWRGMFTRPVLARGGFDAATTLMYTYALANMRIADATTVINAAPIVGTLMAVVILKERVDALRWTAIIVGFAGVVLVLRPEASGFNVYGLLALGAMVTVAGREVVTRRVAAEVPSLIVTLWSALNVTAVGLVASLTTGSWTPVGYPEFGLIFVSALFLFGAYHTSVICHHRLGPGCRLPGLGRRAWSRPTLRHGPDRSSRLRRFSQGTGLFRQEQLLAYEAQELRSRTQARSRRQQEEIRMAARCLNIIQNKIGLSFDNQSA